MTKAEKVRGFAAKNPNLTASELLEFIRAEEPSLKLSIQEVYKYRRQANAPEAATPPPPPGVEPPAKRKPGRPKKVATPQRETSKPATPPKEAPPRGLPLSELLANLKGASDAVGGREEAVRLLNLLG